jgi:ATP-dependent Zn protease
MSTLGVIAVTEVPSELVFKECTAMLKNIEEKTTNLLDDNRHLLQAVSSRLLEEETLERARFLDIIQTA